MTSGGKRKNSGAKRKYENEIKFKISLEMQEEKQLKSLLKKGENRTQKIRELIVNFIKENAR